tara:strand:- start:68 stop:244 length:177 start_codon:yes stop_codon:yes gene_type:complete
MSEPWNTDEDLRDSKKVDCSAKAMLLAGLVMSFASVAVGSVVRPLLERLRARANKDKG